MIGQRVLLKSIPEQIPSENHFKIENFDRPNKDFVYIFAFIALIFFGFLNYKNYRFSGKQY